MELHITAARQAKLLSLLRRELKMSAGLIRRLKFQNCFFVDGASAHTDHIVQIGQVVSVLVREAADTPFAPEHTPIDVVYEDDCLLAVDKPAGVIVHPTYHRTTGTLLTQVMGYYERTGQDCAIHFVNRLDRDTCGVVLLAKNSYVHGLCYELQLRGAFRKTYHALCGGLPEPAEGRVELPIGRVGGGSLLRRIDPAGAAALTEYRLLEASSGVSRVELHPVTGRTHQLRLHCLASGFPILGDPQYFTAESRALSARYGYRVQQLCATELSLPHPLTGAALAICAKRDVFLPENG